MSAYEPETKPADRNHASPDTRIRGGLNHLLLVAGLLLAFAPPAMADMLQISATGMTLRCPCTGDPIDDATVAAGVLQSQRNSRYFVPVVFPRDGESVCRLSMIYRDVNANNSIVARLKRKRFRVGNDAFQAPAVMATVQSEAGVVDTVRRATTARIKHAAINTRNSFYFLEVEVPTVNLEILGFQIEIEPAC